MRSVERPAPRWGDKLLKDLSDDELEDACKFVDAIYEQFAGNSPPPVWGFFSSVRSDLIIEKAKRQWG